MASLIFIVFIIDIVNVSSDIRITMFADDTSVSCSHENPADLYRIMNGSLELLRRWFVSNKLTLNVQKTKYILFHHLQRKVNFEGKLSYSSLEIDKVTELRFIGVMIDDYLLWRPHIYSIVAKMAKFINIFYKIRHRSTEILWYFYIIHSYTRT